MTDDLSEESIHRWRRGRFGDPARYFDEIGSTNDEAMRWATLENAPEGAVVVTDHQVTGRGRWGRSWFSEPGAAIQFSLILRPRLPVDVLGLLTTALGLACVDGIQVAAGVACSLKWPNDVEVSGRKVAGILVESRVTGHVMDVAVAGMGINVYAPRSELPPEVAARATNIAEQVAVSRSEKAPTRAEIFGWIVDAFERLYADLGTGEGAARLIERATARSEIMGRGIVVRLADGSSFEGRAVRLLPSGALEVAVGDDYRAIHVGEVEQLRTT